MLYLTSSVHCSERCGPRSWFATSPFWHELRVTETLCALSEPSSVSFDMESALMPDWLKGFVGFTALQGIGEAQCSKVRALVWASWCISDSEQHERTGPSRTALCHLCFACPILLTQSRHQSSIDYWHLLSDTRKILVPCTKNRLL